MYDMPFLTMNEYVSFLLTEIERINSYLTSPVFNVDVYAILVSHLVDSCERLSDEEFKGEMEKVKEGFQAAVKEYSGKSTFSPIPKSFLNENLHLIENVFTACIRLVSRKST